MFTLAYPVLLPEGHGFHDDARAIAPLLEGSLRLTCLDFREGHVQPLIVQGFESAEAAKQFAANFGAALQCASLSLAHGLGAVDSDAAVDFVGHYDGHRPAIYSTTPGASPYFATARATSIDHIIGLAERLNHELQNETARRLAGWPELAVAVRLFSEVEFAGGNTARFVVLLSALEVLVPQARGTKRNRVLSLVRDALLSADRKDRKAVQADLNRLYETRNALLHEAKPVTNGVVGRLRNIVRDTLRILVDTPSPPNNEQTTRHDREHGAASRRS